MVSKAKRWISLALAFVHFGTARLTIRRLTVLGRGMTTKLRDDLLFPASGALLQTLWDEIVC